MEEIGRQSPLEDQTLFAEGTRFMVQRYSSLVRWMSGCSQGHRHLHVGTAAEDHSGHGPAAESAPGEPSTLSEDHCPRARRSLP